MFRINSVTIFMLLMTSITANAQIFPPFPPQGKLCRTAVSGNMQLVGPAQTTAWKNTLTLSTNMQNNCPPNRKNYNDPTTNTHFCDSIALPPNVDVSQGIMLQINTGWVEDYPNSTSDVDSDNISAGKLNNSAYSFQTPAVSNSNLTGASANSIINLNLTPQILANVTGSDNMIDFRVQDDTEIVQARLQYCTLPPAKAEVELATSCGCEEVEVDSKYGVQIVCEFCQNSPIVISTQGTVNADRYFVELSEVDMMNWQDVGTPFTSGWQCAPPQTCNIPPFFLASDFLNGNQFQPGKIYKFKFAVGPNWDSDQIFFKIADCDEGPISDIKKEKKRKK